MVKTFAARCATRMVLLAFLVASVGCAAALAGCAPSQDSADQGRDAANGASQGDEGARQGDTLNTALVLAVQNDQVLMMDLDTDTPFFATNLDHARVTSQGKEIDADQLAPGNVVELKGDGAMLQSYPAQYPGITAVDVVSVGSPADAEQHADLIEQVIVVPDPNEVPAGVLECKAHQADISVVLNAFGWDWAGVASCGANAETVGASVKEGSATGVDGAIAEGIYDVRVPEATDAKAVFNLAPVSANVERTPLSGAGDRVDANAEDQDVASTLEESGAIAFTIEPGYLYEVDVEFPQGEASYAFYVVA